MILKFIKFDVENNTIEAQWVEPQLDVDGNPVSFVSCRCENFSADQKAEFLAEVEGGQAYADAMGW